MSRPPYRVKITYTPEWAGLGRVTVQLREAEGNTLLEALAKVLAMWRKSGQGD